MINLRSRHFLLNWGGSSVSSASLPNTTGGGARVPGYALKESSTEVCRDKDLLFCFSLLITSTHPRNTLSSCCWSLAARSNHVLQHLDANYILSPSVNFKGALFLNLKICSIVRDWSLEYSSSKTFSSERKHLFLVLHMLGLGGKRRNCRTTFSRGMTVHLFTCYQSCAATAFSHRPFFQTVHHPTCPGTSDNKRYFRAYSHVSLTDAGETVRLRPQR
jgi:hypothetical protein